MAPITNPRGLQSDSDRSICRCQVEPGKDRIRVFKRRPRRSEDRGAMERKLEEVLPMKGMDQTESERNLIC